MNLTGGEVPSSKSENDTAVFRKKSPNRIQYKATNCDRNFNTKLLKNYLFVLLCIGFAYFDSTVLVH
jgi:hypothetical protein